MGNMLSKLDVATKVAWKMPLDPQEQREYNATHPGVFKQLVNLIKKNIQKITKVFNDTQDPQNMNI